RLHPDVGPPGGASLGGAEQVADDPVARDGNGARGLLGGERGGDLAPGRLGVLVARRQQWFDRPVRPVPGGEQIAGGRDVLVGARQYLGTWHGPKVEMRAPPRPLGFETGARAPSSTNV